jgi:O-antigen/teichoic acid export membrane protein
MMASGRLFVGPPAAFLVVLAEPVLAAWLRNPRIAASSAPFTSVLVAGTVLSVSGYPALSVLYSKNLIRKVVLITAYSAALILPALFFAVQRFGAIGAAWSWLVYGGVTYLSYELCALREIQHTRLIQAILRDFALPCLISFAIAWTIGFWHRQSGQVPVLGLLSIGLITAWLTTLLTCTEMGKRVGAFRWNAAMIR